ncbi:hypothetical protein [Fulvimonas soli]|jgi:hypothetical protein|uniref:Patatin-like phospholipase n=1 Tax=Fulvimonas soli TaxID=155197 RepID=A0A316IZ87_9GAMM|nr:hypothetical protein [Fulvimonas soli]PWK92555.1 hypothetical protein C7456_102290 [Fulvimonas soli]TNY27763.1 hypothetical protein BV497_01740 [Fulvimonas soli]
MPSARRHRSLLRRLYRGLLRLAGWVAIVLDHLKPVRVPLLVLAVAVAAVLGVDQVSELFLIALWTDPDTGRYLWLLAGAALAGLAVWYEARHAYRMVYPRWPALQDPRARGLREWLPRVLGAAVPTLVLLGYLVAVRRVPDGLCRAVGDCLRRDLRAAGLLLETAALTAFFVGRRPLLDRWCAHRGRPPLLAPRPALEPRARRLRELGRAPRRILAGALLLNVAVTVLIGWRPTLLDGGGPLAILLLAAAFLALSGGLLCMLADRRGWPLLSVLLLVTAALHALHLNDNHRVRQYPAMSTHQHPAPPPPDARPRFDDYAQAWLADRCAGRAVCPVVLVSAEGGGIRAAAWTALVLGRLTERVQALAPAPGEPWLARHLFAGSGVSGGSLGLATYVGLLRAPPDGAPLDRRAQALLSHDFLAPALANLFFVDFTQRWLPGAWFDDRARALTRAWENAARKQGVAAFAQPFAAAYLRADGTPDTAAPALFLNSTTVAEGRRFVQHPFQPLATPQRQPWTAAYDGAAWLDPRVPLSEAVLNSARFTYISPAGTLETAGDPRPVPATLQLVDGGYFENSGATTLLEVMRLLRGLAAQRGQRLRFIVLHISNDPQLSDFVDRHDRARFMPFYSADCPAPAPLPPSRPSGEAAAPLRALLDTRSARGGYARAQLLGALHPDEREPARGDLLWHFRLCGGGYPMPLGWTISAPVFEAMRRQLEANYPLDAMARALREQLAPDVARDETSPR